MTINGRRNFTYNGKKYRVMNLCKQDLEGNRKYFVSILQSNGFYSPAHNVAGWDLVKFETIKDAQRYVRDWDFMLDTLY